MYKVVIDTNLLIDGSEDAYNYGNRIIDAVIAGHLQAFANKETLRENQFIAPQKIKDQNYLQKLNYFFEAVQQVNGTVRVEVVKEDPEDDKLIASAVAANADYLISSDQHLLKLGKFEGIKIVRPAEFWNIYQDQTSDGWAKWLKQFIHS